MCYCNGGGKITSKFTKGSIKLAEKGSTIASEGYITTKFITDCVEQNKLLDTNLYKVTSGTKVRNKSGNSDVSIQSFETDDSMSPAPNAIHSARDIKGRNKYTKEEDVAILNFLIDQRRYSEASGMKVFKDMEMLKITSHTASSMNTRYRKYILPNIENYKSDIDPKWLTRLTGGVPVKDKEPDFSADALFTVSRKRNMTGHPSMKKFFKADQSSPSKLVDENKLKLCKPADSTISEHSETSSCANNHKNAAIEKPSFDDVDGDVKEQKKDESVAGSCSLASWHTAEDTVSKNSVRRDMSDRSVNKKSKALVEEGKDKQPHLKEKQSVYDPHSLTESCDKNEKGDELKNNNNAMKETKSDKISQVDTHSPVDIFEMSDGTMTQSEKFIEENETDDFELDPDFVASSKQSFDDSEMLENSEKLLPEYLCSKKDVVCNKNNHQQSDDAETQSQQVTCNTVSSSSDIIVPSTNSIRDDSFDKMLIDYVSSKKEGLDIEKDVNDIETISDEDSFDELLKSHASVQEPYVKHLRSNTKKKNGDKKAVESHNVEPDHSKLTSNKELDDETSKQRRKEINRCTCICKKLSCKYGLSLVFMIKLLIQCNGDSERLESYILYGPYSPMLPPWSAEDDILLMSDHTSEKLAIKFGGNDVQDRYRYLTD